ncbi:MAG: hypothetical protein K2N90_09980, partial [Lachnospiraceae bacterium]|nr:hypothetical protein [Lachnospiraceae bacterium]
NMRQISAKILKCKTSGSARMALTGALGNVAQLKRQLYDDGVDRYELEHAIIHAMKIARVAKKKLKHLQEEEAAKKGGMCSGSQADVEEDFEEMYAEEMLSDGTDDAGNYGSDPVQEIKQDLQREMQRKMAEAMQEEMQQLLKEALDEDGLDELSEEMISAFSADMDPDDLEEMKKKHRSEELKEILEADMKYLKAIFNKLQREKEAGSSANTYSNADYGGVSLELGGAEIPLDMELPADIPITAEGGNIDYMA